MGAGQAHVLGVLPHLPLPLLLHPRLLTHKIQQGPGDTEFYPLDQVWSLCYHDVVRSGRNHSHLVPDLLHGGELHEQVYEE